MRHILLPLGNEASWQTMPKAEQEEKMAAYGVFVQELVKSGALVGNYRPQPSSAARTVRIIDSET